MLAVLIDDYIMCSLLSPPFLLLCSLSYQATNPSRASTFCFSVFVLGSGGDAGAQGGRHVILLAYCRLDAR
jgi:hypothetical protein